jgi:hypothetical protein
MKRKTKDAILQMRIDKEMLEWFDNYAKQRGTDRTKILRDFVTMLWKIEHGRSGKGERMQTS